MPEAPIQSSLFEEDYLLRELGQVAQVPQVALTELVANAWDAGATRVSLQLPSALGGVLTVEDNGHGMSPEQFKLRWMTLRYDRQKRQSADVEFPPGEPHRPRKAYGRNGVGRHGLLCFANHYLVETWREGVLGTFEVATESGPSPFVLRSEILGKRMGAGTKASVLVERKLPDANEILTVLAARFVHDPEFEVRVNGMTRAFSDIEGRVSETVIPLDGGRLATIIVIDTTRLNQSSIHQGIAFGCSGVWSARHRGLLDRWRTLTGARALRGATRSSSTPRDSRPTWRRTGLASSRATQFGNCTSVRPSISARWRRNWRPRWSKSLPRMP